VRTPLASIAGAAGILQRNPRLEKKDAECLGIITKECQRLSRLVTHFLVFARPRTPNYQSTDVGTVIESVVELAAHAVGQKPIALRRSVAQQVGTIECDPELLKQVLLNLVINAVQATPDGGEVLVAARPRDGRVLIEVRDEGCGISAADRDKIFDPFFTTKENGTGLGLSVAHQIVEQHGGILTAESNARRGVTFSVLLPVRHERNMRRRSILVVDDDESLRRVTQLQLQEAGYDVLTAPNGEQAPPLVEAEAPALVISDLKMPGVSSPASSGNAPSAQVQPLSPVRRALVEDSITCDGRSRGFRHRRRTLFGCRPPGHDLFQRLPADHVQHHRCDRPENRRNDVYIFKLVRPVAQDGGT